MFNFFVVDIFHFILWLVKKRACVTCQKNVCSEASTDRKLLFWVNIEFITFQVWLLVIANTSQVNAYQGVSFSLYPKTKFQPESRFIFILCFTFITFFFTKNTRTAGSWHDVIIREKDARSNGDRLSYKIRSLY